MSPEFCPPSAIPLPDGRSAGRHRGIPLCHHDILPKPSMTDPWRRTYQYLNIEDADIKGKGQLRKDKNLVPINSDFDLYSVGPDGQTVAPLTAKASHDDVIRASDGAYFGVASKY